MPERQHADVVLNAGQRWGKARCGTALPDGCYGWDILEHQAHSFDPATGMGEAVGLGVR